MNAVRVAILSAVRHAEPYAEILEDDPRTEVVGVMEDPTTPDWMRDTGTGLAAGLEVPSFDDLDDLIERTRPDVALVCSEPVRHAPLAVRALRVGLPVLVDKPAATTVAALDEIASAATAADLPVGVVNRTGSPAVQRLRRWVDAGHLGLPLHVDVEWFASGAHFSTSVERPELVVDPDLSGGGELLNFLLYPLDYIRLLTGLDVEQVHCEAATLFNDAHHATGVEDTAVVSLRLQRGVTATVTLGRIPAAPGLGPVTSTVRLLGSHGHAAADDDRPQLQLSTAAGGVEAIPVHGPSSTAILTSLLPDTLTTLARHEQPAYGLPEARAALVVTEAAYRSTRTGQPVDL